MLSSIRQWISIKLCVNMCESWLKSNAYNKICKGQNNVFKQNKVKQQPHTWKLFFHISPNWLQDTFHKWQNQRFIAWSKYPQLASFHYRAWSLFSQDFKLEKKSKSLRAKSGLLSRVRENLKLQLLKGCRSWMLNYVVCCNQSQQSWYWCLTWWSYCGFRSFSVYLAEFMVLFP